MTIRATRTDSRPEEFLEQVPNRSLSEDEYQALDPERRKAVRDSGLYSVKTDQEMSGKTDKKGGDSA